MDKNKLKVAIYARVSTSAQALDGFSIQAQIDTITKHCHQEGYSVYDIYADKGVSGTSRDKRVELQRLMSDAENGKFQKVYVWKISRMARNTSDLLHIVEELQRSNVEFKSLSENFEVESSTGKMIAQILASFSEYERNVMVDNVKEGQGQRALSGLTNGASVLGYDKPDHSKDPITINQYEAGIVRQIYDMYERSNGFRAIANRLNQQGYETKRGNAFGITAIKDILLNPIYKGFVRYRNYLDWNQKRRKGKNPNPIIVQGKHEAIITESQWDRVQQQLKSRSNAPKILGDGTNNLTGLLRCPECDGAMAASNTTNRLKSGEKKRIRYYSCATFRSKGSSVCHANSIRADDIEPMIAENIMALINQPEVLKHVITKANERLIEQQARQVDHEPHLQAEVENLVTKISNLTMMTKTDESLSLILNDKINEYKEKLLATQQLIQQGESAKKKVVPVKYSEDEMQAVLNKIQEAFNNGNKMAIKQLYLNIIQRITFKKTKPRNIDSFTIYLKPDIGGTLLEGINADEDSTEASSFSMPEEGIVLHHPRI